GFAAARAIEHEQTAAEAQRLDRFAAHASQYLCSLDAPQQALRRPGRILERAQFIERRDRRRQVAGLRGRAGRPAERVVQPESVVARTIEAAGERERPLGSVAAAQLAGVGPRTADLEPGA